MKNTRKELRAAIANLTLLSVAAENTRKTADQRTESRTEFDHQLEEVQDILDQLNKEVQTA